MDVNGTKIMAICVLGMASVITSFSVIRFNAVNTNKRLVSLAAVFAAGVFLVIGIAHMLYESELVFRDHWGDETTDKYLPAYIFTCLGYFLATLLSRCSDAHSHSHSGEESETEMSKSANQNGDGSSSSNPENNMITESNNDPQQQQQQVSSNSVTIAKETESEEYVNNMTIVNTMLALCLHSAIEGFVLGAQPDRSGALLIFIAILVHQWAEDVSAAILTGKALLRLRNRYILALVLSWSCPAGIALGWIIRSSVSPIAEGIILALSTGSFISLACSELVSNEMSGGLSKSWPKFISFFSAILITYLLLVFVK